MISRKVNHGYLGANVSCQTGLYLIQATADEAQVRVSLDKQQLEAFIQTLQNLLEKKGKFWDE